MDNLTPTDLRKEHMPPILREQIEVAVVRTGSRAYGLATNESDIDTRGLFTMTDPGDILGVTSNCKHTYHFIRDQYDYTYMSLQHLLSQLGKGSFNAYEFLHTSNVKVVDGGNRLWYRLLEHRQQLVNIDGLYRSARGVLFQAQRGLGNGGPRSGKNLSHGLRVARSVTEFFKSGRVNYPVDLTGTALIDLLKEAKTGNLTEDQRVELYSEAEVNLGAAYAEADRTPFDTALAIEIVRDTYFP